MPEEQPTLKQIKEASEHAAENLEAKAKQQDLAERIEKLAKAGAWDPLMVLKMRVDLIAQLLVPDSLVGMLENAWEGLMERYIEDVETRLNRETLLEGVRPPQ